MTRSAILVSLAMLICETPSHAREVAGVEVPETLQYEGRTLHLNGVGVRKKLGAKVYVGAMYLETPSRNANEILEKDQVRVVKMTFLRNVDKGKIIDAYEQGFEKNSRSEMPRLNLTVARLHDTLGDMGAGKSMTVAYVPGEAVTVTQQDGGHLTIERDPRMVADAMLRNWIGEQPADGTLKKDLLGGK